MNRCLASLLLALALLAPASRAETETFRLWTSSDGKTVDAALVAVEGDTVKLKLRTGAVVPVPLARLSPADQTLAKQSASTPGAAPAGGTVSTKGAPAAVSEAAAASGSSLPPGPPAEKTWPRTVAVSTDMSPVTVVKEDAAKHEFIYRSDHYEFRCDSKLGTNVVREFNRLFEATYMVNCLLPLDFKPKPEPLHKYFVAQLYTKKDDYFSNGGLKGSAGVYQGAKKELSVPLSSLGVMMVGSRVSLEPSKDEDNATLVHEITHQMMNHWLRHLPVWYIEGSAEYVSILKYEHGRFSLSGLGERLHHFIQRRTGDAKHYTMLDLEELMNLDSATWANALANGKASMNYGSAALLTYYFYHLDGQRDAANMIAYLRAVENAKTKEEHEAALKSNLLRGRTYAELQTEVKKGLRKEGIEVDFATRGQKVSESAQ